MCSQCTRFLSAIHARQQTGRIDADRGRSTRVGPSDFNSVPMPVPAPMCSCLCLSPVLSPVLSRRVTPTITQLDARAHRNLKYSSSSFSSRKIYSTDGLLECH